MNTLRAGYAQVEITPPVGIDLTGFFARQQPSIGVHDPLFARAAVLDDGRTRVGIVICDLLGFSREFDQELRTAIARTGVLPSSHLMIACIHTHSGPACMWLRGCGQVNAKWMAWLRGQIVRAVVKAGAPLHPVTVHLGRHRADISKVRWLAGFDHPFADVKKRRTRPRVREVSVIQLKRGARPLLSIVHYPCHPVVMGSANRKISADFPGVVASFLKRKTGAPAMFLNGACGNLNPRVALQSHQPVGFKRLRKVGEDLGRSALQALRRARPIRDPRLSATFRRVRVPLRIPSVRKLEAMIQKHQRAIEKESGDSVGQSVSWAFLEWAREALATVKSGKFSRHTAISLQQMSIGPLRLVALGGEPFDELGARIQRRAGAPCLVVGYANGIVGYLPTRAAFRHGGYEVNDAHKFYGLFGLSSRLENTLIHAVKRMGH